MANASIYVVLALTGCGMMGPKQGEKPEAGVAKQELVPIEQIDTWLNALHVERDDASHMAEVQHYCDVLDEDLIQCALYDRTGKRAHLVGVEYVLSEAAFNRLPPREQELWHPHNYEILSGQLVAPGMPKAQEEALMARMMNTYGKTWHTWPTGTLGHNAPSIPVGEPALMWSFNADNEAPRDLVEARDKRLDVDSNNLRVDRQILVKDAHPQEGVNTMAKDFPNRRPIPGVRAIYPTDRQRGSE